MTRQMKVFSIERARATHNGRGNGHGHGPHAGAAFDDRLDYVFGLYYFDEQGEELSPWEITAFNPLAGGAIILDLGNWFQTESTASAACGQFTYDRSERFNATLNFTGHRR